MARGNQVDVGGIKVDRPIWAGTDGRPGSAVDRPTPQPADEDRAAGRNGAAHDVGGADGGVRRLPDLQPYETSPEDLGWTGAVTGAPRQPVDPPQDHQTAAAATPPQHPPVDIDLTLPDPAAAPAPRPEPAPEPTDPRPPVDIDLTAPLAALPRLPGLAPRREVRRPVDIDLTAPIPAPPGTAPAPAGLHPGAPGPASVPDPATAPPVPKASHSPIPAAAAATAPPKAARRGRGDRLVDLVELAVASRRIRRLARPFRRPGITPPTGRVTLAAASLVALLVVCGAIATSALSRIQDRHEFLSVTEPLHRDPAVADDVAGRVTALLVEGGSIDPSEAASTREDMAGAIRSESFAPVWRTSLQRAHKRAMGGQQWMMPIGDAMPELVADLESSGSRREGSVGKRNVAFVPDAYVAQVTMVSKLLRLAGLAAPAAAAGLALVMLWRSANRWRTASLLAGLTSLVALVGLVAVGPVVDLAVGIVVSGPAEELGGAAASGAIPAMRIVLAILVVAGAALAIAGRLEEVRSAPPFAAADDAGRRPRRRRAVDASAALRDRFART